MHQNVVRTALVLSALLCFTAADVHAQWVRSSSASSQLRFRFGVFDLTGDSTGWDSVFEGFTGGPSDLEDIVWGMDFFLPTGRHTGLLFGGSYFQGEVASAYRDWETFDGRRIWHESRIEISDLTAALLVFFNDRGVRPYLGAGAGLVSYTLVDEGEFIDFGAPEQPVIWAWYGTEGTALEAFGIVGVDIPLGYRWSVFFEGRYRWAEDSLGDDFSGFGDLDLGGSELTGGIAVRF